MADGPLEAALLVTGELVKFRWYTYSYFYLKLDEKEQSVKPPQQSSTKKTGKRKCVIEIAKRFKG